MLKCFKSRNFFQDFSNFFVLHFLEKIFEFIAHLLISVYGYLLDEVLDYCDDTYDVRVIRLRQVAGWSMW